MPTPPEVFTGAIAVILIAITAIAWVMLSPAKKIANPAIASLRAMGDGASALFDKEPDKKHLETALRHYQEAAALTDKDKDPLTRADIQLLAGQTLHKLARYEEAEPLMRAAADIRRDKLGENSPEYAAAIGNLAELLRATNRMAEAEPLMRRALEITEAAYGKSHPDVARDLSNLAGLLHATNRMEEAEPMLRRALEIAEATYGKSHPKVAISLNNLAGLLQDTNRMAEAEPMLRRALEIFEASLGKEHPDTVGVRENLEILRKELGK